MNETILLVEDDPFLVEIYKEKLTKKGFKVKVIEKGSQVLEALKKEDPALLVLDIVLPEIDGWQVLRKVKKDSSFKHTKIVILSNLSQKQEIKKGLELGADKYLIKAHYTPSEVVEEIKKIL